MNGRRESAAKEDRVAAYAECVGPKEPQGALGRSTHGLTSWRGEMSRWLAQPPGDGTLGP